jgi:hypothetical protein
LTASISGHKVTTTFVRASSTAVAAATTTMVIIIFLTLELITKDKTTHTSDEN